MKHYSTIASVQMNLECSSINQQAIKTFLARYKLLKIAIFCEQCVKSVNSNAMKIKESEVSLGIFSNGDVRLEYG